MHVFVVIWNEWESNHVCGIYTDKNSAVSRAIKITSEEKHGKATWRNGEYASGHNSAVVMQYPLDREIDMHDWVPYEDEDVDMIGWAS